MKKLLIFGDSYSTFANEIPEHKPRTIIAIIVLINVLFAIIRLIFYKII